MAFIKMGKEIARDGGVLLGKWMGGDSCNANSTANWTLTDCTMAHNTDHFGVGDGRGYYRVTRTNSSQHIRKDLTHALTVDRVYKVLIQIRTNVALGSAGSVLLDLKSSGDGSGGTPGSLGMSTIIDSLPGWTQLEFNYTAIVASDEMRLLLWLTENGHTFDFRQFNVYEALIP